MIVPVLVAALYAVTAIPRHSTQELTALTDATVAASAPPP